MLGVTGLDFSNLYGMPIQVGGNKPSYKHAVGRKVWLEPTFPSEKQNPNRTWLLGTPVYGKKSAGTSEGDMFASGAKNSGRKAQNEELQPTLTPVCP